MERTKEDTVLRLAERHPLTVAGSLVNGTGPHVMQDMWDRTAKRTDEGAATIAGFGEIAERHGDGSEGGGVRNARYFI